jgi:hypothetical protein
MNERIAGQPPRSFWRRYRIAVLIGVLALAGLCAAAIFLLLFSSGPTVTPGLEHTAQQAVLNPASAKLHVGHYGDVNDWHSPRWGDYAVQDGVVIFPEPATAGSPFNISDMVGDKKLSVLAYAPDGRDLAARPGPPADRSWFYGMEWYLYNCRPVADHPLWWECTLLVGGNI